ncbi:MAG: glutamate synthase large subunit [Rhodospirillaceae bacterium]|nr:glutamate synthase large subunit [Rhodospirillaceae bacterium]MBT7485006.1 glutamate synthase large subunit [Rhodospirillales bacterium]MBT4701748.1 glutamate synthase large subunit [Rhodospirillaceae bacterium]MBT5033806.1 glutamate synthase large subunit [Rhodospirillaceae bacterium]MBT6220785.1 glutamate synthase large subunit [Rhodospirillaceae bacterium]
MREKNGNYPGMPPKQGLYDPLNEHDACGIGFVANIKNRKSHEIVKQGLQVLDNVTHRGAAGADPLAGDGAGILIQIPDTFLRAETKGLGIDLPAVGDYGVAMVFFPHDDTKYDTCEKIFLDNVKAEGQKFLGWRDVPVDSSVLGESVKPMEPRIRQGFIARGKNCADTDAFELKLFVIRKQIQRGVREMPGLDFFIPSMSARTLCYKGMILAGRVADYYLDLQDETLDSALALVHQRFSTNTFPSWELAQPFRYLCHNGEINTVRGNINWMAARRSSMKSEILGDDLDKLWPLLIEGRSDSATFDNALELLVSGGYSLAHAMMLMVPEAWSNNPLMDEKRRAFYEYNAALMEPWDGPAAVAFTDGRQIGATLDRNGLRPARYVVTEDDLVVMGSEVGVITIPEEKIVQKWRLQPGKMFLIDLEQGRIIDDEELKADLANANPYQDWLDKTQIMLEDLPAKSAPLPPNDKTLLNRQQAFGYTQEDQKFFLEPMAVTGQDPVGAMGRDTPPAVLSDRPKMLSDYFKQCFAQVTNPPIDPIREELVMSLVSLIGPRPNLLDLKSGGTHNRMEVRQPILTNIDLEKIRHFEFNVGKAFRTYTLDICYAAEDGAEGMAAAVEGICKRAEEVVRDRYNILVLSDRGMDENRIAIPALLATGAVHHHLIREGLRTNAGLVVETGEARLVHDFCLLAGYGAEAVNPYLAFDVLTSLLDDMPDELDAEEVHKRYIKAIDKGMLKVMSKMGISTYQSYCGAQIFDAVGLNSVFIEKYFEGTASAIEGIGLAEVAEETVRRHQLAYGDAPIYQNHLDVGGDMAYRLRGEVHHWTPETVSLMQHAVRGAGQEKYDEYARHMNEQTKQLKTLRGLMDFKFDETNEIPLDEVEPAKEIVKRFATGAMSFGSISFEAHTTLAIAMNRIGGKSNTGEGGELPERFKPLPNGDSMRSAIKQVASGRFGVTAEYLANADELQIKMAQGAKPGEGGQLPGHKVDQTIAQVRYSTPGVGLISPPPHHDIYSIEDLAQLIHDLKNANREARVSVKLVSTVGVGTIAAGVSKAHADHVLISGYDGGTGASPLTSVMHAGSPWEIGLAETQQTLVLNRLRSRIAVQVDGGIRTGRDVAIGALLGADEFGFATSALIATGCIMMRKCHLNTCPVGIATQDAELRKRFKGEPEHVVNFLFFVAEELRTIMAKLGFRTMKEMTGRSDLLDMRTAIDHWKAKGLDYTKLLHKPDMGPDVPIYHCEGQDHGLDKALDNMLIEKAQPAIENGTPVQIETSVLNINRTVGTMLSNKIAKRYGNAGLPDDTIYIKSSGSAGQSFGAFLAHGITIEHVGDANDYTGKGLSGGRLMIYPAENVQFKPEENIIIGNVVLYGATGGEAYFRGVAGERFGVRNSGATAVVEGVGDHGCEYMTGGIVVVLGQSGRNFAAGMSGGIAYVLDEEGDFEQRCNLSMVELEPIPNEDLHHDQGRHQKGDLEGHGLVDVMHDMTRYDSMRLHTLIENHKKYTNSSRAQEILDNWDDYLQKFVKVMPVDYRRALMKMAEKARMRGQPCAAVAVGD